MADVLELSEAERVEFFTLGGLAHVPECGNGRRYLIQAFNRLRETEQRFYATQAELRAAQSRSQDNEARIREIEKRIGLV